MTERIVARRDRATYDPKLTAAVNYTVASAADAPASLTYGPSFFTLAAALPGDVTLGLNRRLNNQTNTLAAASTAQGIMRNLYAIELGNEPECARPSPVSFPCLLNVRVRSLLQRLAHRALVRMEPYCRRREPKGVGNGSSTFRERACRSSSPLPLTKKT